MKLKWAIKVPLLSKLRLLNSLFFFRFNVSLTLEIIISIIFALENKEDILY